MIKTDRYKSKFNNLGETRDQVCNKLGEFAERTFSGIEAAVAAFQEHNYQPNKRRRPVARSWGWTSVL